MDLYNSAGGQEPREDDLLFDATWSNAHLCSDIPSKVASNPPLFLYNILSAFRITLLPLIQLTRSTSGWIYLNIHPNSGIHFYTEVHGGFPFTELLLSRTDFDIFELHERLIPRFNRGCLLKIHAEALLEALTISKTHNQSLSKIRLFIYDKKFYYQGEARRRPLRRVRRYRALQISTTDSSNAKLVPYVEVPAFTSGDLKGLSQYQSYSKYQYGVTGELYTDLLKKELIAVINHCKDFPMLNPPTKAHYYGELHYRPDTPEILIHPAPAFCGNGFLAGKFIPLPLKNVISKVHLTDNIVRLFHLGHLTPFISHIQRHLHLQKCIFKIDTSPLRIPFQFWLSPTSYIRFYID